MKMEAAKKKEKERKAEEALKKQSEKKEKGNVQLSSGKVGRVQK